MNGSSQICFLILGSDSRTITFISPTNKPLPKLINKHSYLKIHSFLVYAKNDVYGFKKTLENIVLNLKFEVDSWFKLDKFDFFNSL